MEKYKSPKIKKDEPAVPQEQWLINLNLTPEGDNSAWGAFLPRNPSNRPTPHVKINECDH